MDKLLDDLKFAGRWLRRSPGFATISVASLAIGIAFNATLFAVGDANAHVLLAQVRRELLSMDQNLLFLDNQTMDAQIAATLYPVRVGASLLTGAGAVAMLFAAIGLYG